MTNDIFGISTRLEPWANTVGVWIFSRPCNLASRERYICTNLTMAPLEDGLQYNPLFRLNMEEAQRLANDLWEAGIRPVSAKGSAGQLAAVQAHLEDFRKLVLKEKYERGK